MFQNFSFGIHISQRYIKITHQKGFNHAMPADHIDGDCRTGRCQTRTLVAFIFDQPVMIQTLEHGGD
jgi:hypothetical protein